MFKNSKNKVLAITGLNLFAITSGLFAQGSNINLNHQAIPDKNESATLNAASLKAIESSWIKVPVACKAKGFNAEATSLVAEQHSDKVMAVFNSFDVANS